jgi:hypothetical protein
MNKILWRRVMPMLVLFVGIVGCSPSKPATVPVVGKVMFKKTTPAAGALVVFHPVKPETETLIGGKPFATVKEDGTFTLTTFQQDDGAPEGEYKVTVDWRKKSDKKLSLGSEGGGDAGSMIQAKYGNPASPAFPFTVKKGEPNNFVIEVD